MLSLVKQEREGGREGGREGARKGGRKEQLVVRMLLYPKRCGYSSLAREVKQHLLQFDKLLPPTHPPTLQTSTS